VSIDLGDFGADPDTLFLQIFNSSNVSLGFASLAIPDTDSTMHTLSLSSPNIAYAIFGARAPAINGSSVFADNFTFAASSVPEPSTILQLALGLLGVTAIRRRVW